MATTKTILQNVAASAGITVPDSFVGNSDETPRKLLRAFSAAGRHLAQKPWRALTFEHTFSTSDGTLSYALPTDPAFDRLIPGTAFDRSQYRGLTGPEQPAQWQYGEALLSSPGTLNTTFRIKRDTNTTRDEKIYLLDDPNGTYTLAFEYITGEWIYDGSSTYYTDVQADADVPLLDAYLMEIETLWRTLRANGEPYFDEKDEAMRLCHKLLAQENQKIVDLRARARRFTSFVNNIPETGYGL